VFKLKNTLQLSSHSVEVEEMNFKTYKTLLKLFFRKSEYGIFSINILHFLAQHSDITIDELKKLNCIDILMLLIEIRILSLGAALTVHIKKRETEGNEEAAKEGQNQEGQVTTEPKEPLRVSKNLHSLQTSLRGFTEASHVVYNNLSIKLTTPRFIDLHKEHDIFDYIEYLEIGNNKLVVDCTQKQNYLDSLPPFIIQELQKIVTQYIQRFENINFIYAPPDDKNSDETIINFVLNYEFLVYVISLLYGDDLVTIHQNSFKLSQFANINLNYIDNCAPGEALMYMKILDAEIKLKNQMEQQRHASNKI